MYELEREPLGDLEDARVAVELAVADPPDARVRDLLEARPAGRGGHVERGAVEVYAVLGGLDDGVRLGVDRRHTMITLHHVADVRTVGHPADRAVVAGGEDRLVSHDHRADELARAGRARSHHLSD